MRGAARQRPGSARARPAAALGGLCALILSAASAAAWSPNAQPETLIEARAFRVRALAIERPEAVAHSAGFGRFYVLGPVGSDATRLAVLDERGVALERLDLPEPLHDVPAAAFDEATGRLWMYDAAEHALWAMPVAAGGTPDLASATRTLLPRMGPLRVGGLAVAPGGDALYLLDRLTRRVARIELAPEGARVAAWIADTELRNHDLRGIAVHPSTGALVTLSASARRVLELAPDGRVAAARDLPRHAPLDPRGVAFAPTGDATDDPEALALYVADRGSDHGLGQVVELKRVPAHAPESGEVLTASAPLIRTTETSQYSPPSPDPSGIAYDPALKRLVLVDGEVEEMRIWRDVNVFEASPTGPLVRPGSTFAYSIEPVGVAVDPVRRRYFVSDDDAREVFEIALGSDGLLGTSDDQRRSFDTVQFGSDDPEGITYDAAANRLFVADGVNAEIYEIRPGPNGLFEGRGDDVITHFDTARLGIHDPETVEFDPSTGRLFAIGSGAGFIADVTTAGSLFAKIDITAVPLDKPAGMALAPRSSDPTQRSLYVCDRGVDNNSDSRENDGRVFEIGIGGASSGGGPAPVADAIEARIAAGSDDAEEAAGGAMDVSGSDLELVTESSVQTVGLRFANLAIPRGAAIASAWIQFRADETASGATSLVIHGEAADAPQPFASGARNVSSRPRTGASVAWSPAAWSSVGEASAPQRTPDLAAIVREIVARPGWSPGGAMAFVVTGTGRRTAESYEGLSSGAALLHVELARANTAPRVSAGADLVVVLPDEGELDGTVADDGLPSPPGRVAIQWTALSGPGSVTFAAADAPDTRVRFGAVGRYLLRLSASDGTLSARDTIAVDVQLPPPPPSQFDVRIAAGSDDAEESASGSVSLTSSDIDLVTDGSAAQTVGLRFPGIPLPRGATIARAWLQLKADEASAVPTALVIHGEAADDAATFASGSRNVTGRARTAESVAWTPDPWGTIGEAGLPQRSPDLARVVQAIVDRPGWRQGGAIALIVSGSGKRAAEAYESDRPGAALLHVEIRPPEVETVLERRVIAGADDAEESASGTVALASTDLDLVDDGSRHTVAMRFTGMTIPQGATVTRAWVQFKADKTTDGPTTLAIAGQASDDAPPIAATGRDVSSRPRTPAVAWSPSPWIAGEAGAAQRTPDLSAAIGAIVQRPGWRSGGAIVLIVTGSGLRAAESYEGAKAAAPLLHVEYR